jgi:hypothetical protein
MVSPSRRRDAVRFLVGRHAVSERRACNLLGQHRSTQRYVSRPPELEERLVERMNVLAARYPRYGYRRIWMLLRGEGFEVNRKRIERLCGLRGTRCLLSARVPARKHGAARAVQRGVGDR